MNLHTILDAKPGDTLAVEVEGRPAVYRRVKSVSHVVNVNPVVVRKWDAIRLRLLDGKVHAYTVIGMEGASAAVRIRRWYDAIIGLLT